MTQVLKEDETILYPQWEFDKIVDGFVRSMGIKLMDVKKKTLDVRHKGKMYVGFLPNGMEFRGNPSSPVVWVHLPNQPRNVAMDTGQRMAGIIVKR